MAMCVGHPANQPLAFWSETHVRAWAATFCRIRSTTSISNFHSTKTARHVTANRHFCCFFWGEKNYSKLKNLWNSFGQNALRCLKKNLNFFKKNHSGRFFLIKQKQSRKTSAKTRAKMIPGIAANPSTQTRWKCVFQRLFILDLVVCPGRPRQPWKKDFFYKKKLEKSFRKAFKKLKII